MKQPPVTETRSPTGHLVWLPLGLVISAPTLGVVSAMILFPGSVLGTSLFFGFKAILFLFPLLWHTVIDGHPISFSAPTKGGFGVSALSGLAMSAGIIAAYLILGNALIDISVITDKMVSVGLSNINNYLLGSAYWILINSVLEEYVWRWFVFTKAEKRIGTTGAMLVSSIGFTLHHIVAMAQYFSGLTVLLCSIGIFTGGIVWCMTYDRFRSIWPGYLSHAIVDLAVFGIGFRLLFL